MIMSTTQQVRVLWNGSYSRGVPATIGMKQGDVLCPILFCVYINVLVTTVTQLIREAWSGCFVSGWFVGVMASDLAEDDMSENLLYNKCNQYLANSEQARERLFFFIL